MRHVAFLIGLLICLQTYAQSGIQFFEGTWEEALAEAEKTGKPIFLDAYTTWCGPCKMMSARVFPDAKVGQLFNEYFVNVQLDMEKDESVTFRQRYTVEAFPTLFFFRSDGTLERRVKGAQQAEGLIQLGRSILRALDPVEDYAEKYAAGERDPQFVYRYLQSLIRAEEPYSKIVNEYFRDQAAQLSEPENLELIFQVTTDADSKAFSLLAEHHEAIRELVGPERFEEKVLSALVVSLEKAEEFNSPFLFDQAIETAEGLLPRPRLRRIQLEGQLALLSRAGDLSSYLNLCDQYVEEVLDPQDAQAHYTLAAQLLERYGTDSEAVNRALRYSRMAYENDPQTKHGLLYATALVKVGKDRQARKLARDVLDRLPESDVRGRREVQLFIDRL